MSELKCILYTCQGDLVRYPMDLLMQPPIQQWECRKCNAQYRRYSKDSLLGEGLRIITGGRQHNWMEMYIFMKERLKELGVKDE